jgi:nitrate reductase NapD
MASEAPAETHISSAVVMAMPNAVAAVSASILALPLTEIYHQENGKFIVLLEGASAGEVGARLAEIGLFDGVIAANLVYEHIEAFEPEDMV